MPRMYCSLVGLLNSPYPPRLFGHSHVRRQVPVHNDMRDPSRERWNCVGENWLVILPAIATSTSIQGSFTRRKSATWDPQLFRPEKS